MDFNEKIKYFVRFYMKNNMIKKCKNCNVMTHIDFTSTSNKCNKYNHDFYIYTNIFDINNDYLIDINFSTWIHNNKYYIERKIHEIETVNLYNKEKCNIKKLIFKSKK